MQHQGQFPIEDYNSSSQEGVPCLKLFMMAVCPAPKVVPPEAETLSDDYIRMNIMMKVSGRGATNWGKCGCEAFCGPQDRVRHFAPPPPPLKS